MNTLNISDAVQWREIEDPFEAKDLAIKLSGIESGDKGAKEAVNATETLLRELLEKNGEYAFETTAHSTTGTMINVHVCREDAEEFARLVLNHQPSTLKVMVGRRGEAPFARFWINDEREIVINER